MNLRMSLGLLPVAGALVACSPQVDGDYHGEPMATLRGVVASGAALDSVPELNAGIVWLSWGDGPGGPKYVGERVAVEGSFPANFKIQLFLPPPAAAEAKDPVDTRERTGIWAGYLAAIDARAGDGAIGPEDILGIDVDHILFYADHASEDSEPGISLDWRVGYEYGPGYRLFTRTAEREALDREARECGWKGLCVHWLGDDVHQDHNDWAFERCQERFPENPTCSAFLEHAASGEPESSRECRERYESLADRDACGYSTSEPSLVDAEDGLSTPIEIQLGKSIWDGPA